MFMALNTFDTAAHGFPLTQPLHVDYTHDQRRHNIQESRHPTCSECTATSYYLLMLVQKLESS